MLLATVRAGCCSILNQKHTCVSSSFMLLLYYRDNKEDIYREAEAAMIPTVHVPQPFIIPVCIIQNLITSAVQRRDFCLMAVPTVPCITIALRFIMCSA